MQEGKYIKCKATGVERTQAGRGYGADPTDSREQQVKEEKSPG